MTDRPANAAGIRTAHGAVTGRIAAACARVGRDPASVTLVAVSKTVPAHRLRDAITAGMTVFGENRVQEAASKVPEVPGATWHLIGPLQSNKARRAVTAFDLIESVDTVDLVIRLDRIASEVRASGPAPTARYPILLQVNVDADPDKSGFAPGALPAALDAIADLDALEVRGLMTIGRLVSDPADARPTFVALRRLSEDLRATGRALGPDLSMGMSDDFEVAVEEGATMVRVGRALFGSRPPVR